MLSVIPVKVLFSVFLHSHTTTTRGDLIHDGQFIFTNYFSYSFRRDWADQLVYRIQKREQRCWAERGKSVV